MNNIKHSVSEIMTERMIEEWPDDHWRQVLNTVIERIGEEKFLNLAGSIISARDYTKRLELHVYPDAIKRSEKWRGIK